MSTRTSHRRLASRTQHHVRGFGQGKTKKGAARDTVLGLPSGKQIVVKGGQVFEPSLEHLLNG